MRLLRVESAQRNPTAPDCRRVGGPGRETALRGNPPVTAYGRADCQRRQSETARRKLKEGEAMKAIPFTEYAGTSHKQDRARPATFLHTEEAWKISVHRPGEMLVFLTDDGVTLMVPNAYHHIGSFPLVMKDGLSACWSGNAKSRRGEKTTGGQSEYRISVRDMPPLFWNPRPEGECGGVYVESYCITNWK